MRFLPAAIWATGIAAIMEFSSFWHQVYLHQPQPSENPIIWTVGLSIFVALGFSDRETP